MASNDPVTLKIPLRVWWKLFRQLRRRGGGVRESGAFILGERHGDNAVARRLAFYDDVDPNALSTGIVRLSGHAMNKVWNSCSRSGLQLLADVHTHPGPSGQSDSDRNFPMVATRGHIALIVPNFARSASDLAGVGHYRYLGAKRWAVEPPPRLGFFSVKFRGAT
jgi:proteasome lid subunit RPN8/RPN11